MVLLLHDTEITAMYCYLADVLRKVRVSRYTRPSSKGSTILQELGDLKLKKEM